MQSWGLDYDSMEIILGTLFYDKEYTMKDLFSVSRIGLIIIRVASA